MRKIRAIIFDVDGTLAETEQFGHMPACNDAFAKLGFPIRWTLESYKPLLAIPGTPQRMRLALKQLTPKMSDGEVETAVSQLYPLKNKYFIERYATQLSLRRGVESLIREALAHDVRLAIVTQSHEEQVRTLLKNRLPDVVNVFQPLLGKLAGDKSAPDSPLYRQCLAELGTKTEETLVIEDSEAGLLAAQIAGLPCAVFYNAFSFGSSFAGAALVARSLEYFTLEQLTNLCMLG